MAVSIMFTPPAMTASQYDAIMADLEASGAAEKYPGLISHACYGPDGHLFVHDIWESEAAFKAFSETLFPLIRKHVGPDAAVPQILPVHNILVPSLQAA